jgi:hypothetical protein
MRTWYAVFGISGARAERRDRGEVLNEYPSYFVYGGPDTRLPTARLEPTQGP